MFDVCVGTLLAAMALYGAVQIIATIWIPLCIGATVVVSLAAIIWLIRYRSQRW